MSFPVSKSRVKPHNKSRGSKQIKSCRPQLTSIIDMMTCLLIYMIQSFSSEGEIVTQSKDLILPVSSAQKRPELTINISVNSKYILAENQQVANVDEVLASDDLVIGPLNDWLKDRREQTQKIEKYSNKVKFKGDVTIQGDKRIRFRLLKKIMYTCGQQGFNNFKLAVQQKG